MAYQQQQTTDDTPFFSTPANIKDFQNPKNYQGWSDWISSTTNDQIQALHAVYNRLPTAQLQYINPSGYSASANYIQKSVQWNAFPKRVSGGAYPNQAQLEATDAPLKNNDPKNYFNGWYPPVLNPFYGRVHDEYCEWFVQRDPTTGKIIQVDFTAEGPEYWQFLYDHEPETLLTLYHQLTSLPAGTITLEDLTLPDQGEVNGSRYNPNNKYNNLNGAIHLNCAPNSLAAEINLAALATVLRKDSDGVQITDPVQLCACSGFGLETRNSDPSIGAFVNSLATLRFMITLQNPVGLCIFNFYKKKSGWTGPEGKVLSQDQLNQIVRLTRGEPGFGLHYTVRVPDSFGFVLGDMEIARQPIKYGGQIAYTSVTIGLTGAATQFGQPDQQAPFLPCGKSQASATPQGLVASIEHKVEEALHLNVAPHLYIVTPKIKTHPNIIPKSRAFVPENN